MTAHWKAKPLRPDYDENRMKIVEAAWNIASENGINQLTFAKVAAQADCARSTVYRYFDNKEELLYAVINEAVFTIQQEIMDKTAAIIDPREVIVRGIYLAIVAVKTNPALRLLWFREQTEGLELAELTMDNVPSVIGTVITMSPVFEKAIRDGLIRDEVTADDVGRWSLTIALALSLSRNFGQNETEDLAFLHKMLVPSIFKDSPI
jgi:AcrR family transcriptional regulator